jgi:hypothetical protein
MNSTVKVEILRLAAAVVSGEIEIVEGCRLLVRLFGDAGLRNDPDALVIVGVESETDDIPVGSQRKYWNPTALEAKIAEKADYIATVRPLVLAACHALTTKLCTEM